jgi:hypothetical protein
MSKIAKGWNDFVDAMIYASECWEAHRERMLATPRSVLEDELTYEARKVLSTIIHRMEFDKALPELVANWRLTGGGLPKQSAAGTQTLIPAMTPRLP